MTVHDIYPRAIVADIIGGDEEPLKFVGVEAGSSVPSTAGVLRSQLKLVVSLACWVLL